jgi:hypothetical protein
MASTENLDAPLKGELAHEIGIRELLRCPKSEALYFCQRQFSIKWDEVNSCPAALAA